MVLTMSRVSNTQSRAQDKLTQQQRNGKQAPYVPDNTRTVHAVPSNNNRTVHTVSTKNSHMWTQLERNRDTLKQSLKHHGSPREWCFHQTRESPLFSFFNAGFGVCSGAWKKKKREKNKRNTMKNIDFFF